MVCTTIARIALLTILCLFLPAILMCEQNAPWRFGVSGGAGVQFHSSDFTSLPPIALPRTSAPFTTASGPVLSLGLETQRLLLPWLYAGIGLDMQAWNGTFTADEPSYFIINGVGTRGVITHSLDVSTTSLGIAPSFAIPISPLFSAGAGVQINYLMSNSYEQSQAITEPANLPFVDGGVRPVVSSGGISATNNLSLALAVSLRYQFPLGSSLFLEPELRAHYGLSSLMENVDWRSSGVRGTVALVYAKAEQPPVVLRDTVYRRDTVQLLVSGLARERMTLTSSQNNEVRRERDDVTLLTLEVDESYLREIPRPEQLLAAAVDVRFVQKGGEESQSTLVMVEGKMKRHYLPLLPYVFFEEGTAELADKYKHPHSFATGNAMLDMYYRLLDTVGARMKALPRAHLVLTGVDVKAAEALSQHRAAAVKEYIASRWGIASGRIRVATRNAQQGSATEMKNWEDDNRRVELASEDERVLAPVVLSDIEIIADPPLVRFYPDVVSEAGAASWYLSVALEGAVLREFSGGGSPPRVIEWDISSTPAAARLLAGDSLPLQYEFSATDVEGSVSRTSPGTIRFQTPPGTVDSSFIERTSDRFSLILFNFNAASMSPENRSMVQLIRSAVHQRDSVTVFGFSDATGNEAYNQKLAQQRAEAIASALKLPHTQIAGVGVDPDLPQYLPEGRFYSRRVDVVRERK